MQLRRIVHHALVLAVMALVAAGAWLAITDASDAQESVQVSCPEGWTPSADGTQCLSDAVDDNVVTTTSCTQGVLSADGQFCIVPRLDAAPAPAAPGAPTGDVQAPIPTFTG